jgi:hypothetical protein
MLSMEIGIMERPELDKNISKNKKTFSHTENGWWSKLIPQNR